MVELLLMPCEGWCLRRVKRRPIGNRSGYSSWPYQPNHLSTKNPNAVQAAEQCNPQPIAALDAENGQVLAKIGGVLG